MKSFTLKHLSILCAIVFVALTMPHVFAYPLLSEHVINGGFESGWTGWSKQGPVGLDGSGPHSGSFSAILTTTTGCDMSGIWQLAIPVVANVDYEFSFWYRDDAGHHGVVRTWPDAWCTNWSLPYSASWIQNTCVFSSTSSQDIRIYFDLQSCDNAYFWVDDVSIIEYVPPPPAPIGAAFTYQGRMFDASNAPVQGTCDLALRLYDHDSGGTQIGATVTITSVAMTDGYFDVAPDFGAPSFNGEARWLEIESACPPGAGSTTFPRQAINVVPYALYALNSSAITSTVYVTETVYYTPSYHLQGWETITGTPESYTPTAHTQGWDTITGQPEEYTPTYHLQGWETITGTPSTYTPTAHMQAWSTITGTPASYTPTAIGLTSTYIGYGSAGNTLTGSANATLTDGGSAYFAAKVTFGGQATEGTGGNLIGKGGLVIYGGAIPYAPAAESVVIDQQVGGVARIMASGANTWNANLALNPYGGNVGIGTVAPGCPLEILKTAAGTLVTHLTLTNASDTTNTGVRAIFKNYDNVTAAIVSTRVESGTGGDLRFYTKPSSAAIDESGLIEAMRIDKSGKVGIGTTTPNNFALQVAGNIGPNASNTYDLGSAANYWATIHYHTLTSHSLSVFSTTVTLQNGREVSCLDALKEIKADPSKKIKGVQHMDYATIPSIALNTAPWVYNGSTLEKNGEDGADMDMMVSLVLCAEKELDVRTTALDNRMSDLEKRIADLEQKVK